MSEQRLPYALLTRSAFTCSNMSIGSWTPEAASRSAHFGRIPVARNRPRTRPSWVMPMRSNTKMSCIVMTSPSMPVSSEIAVTFRVPSDMRDDLHDQVHRRGDLLPDRLLRNIEVGHRHHRVQPVQRVTRRVGVDRRQAAVVAGVHRLEHVERFFAADLADDDAVRTHTQRVDHQIALADGALAFDVGRPGLEAHHVTLPQLQLGRVFDRDDALVLADEAGQDVEQRRLAGAGAARDDDVQPAGDCRRRESPSSASSTTRGPPDRRRRACRSGSGGSTSPSRRAPAAG